MEQFKSTNKEIRKRLLTSILLILGYLLIFYSNFILLYSLIIIGIFSLFEFQNIIKKIFKNLTLKILFNTLFLLYIFFYSTVLLISSFSQIPNLLMFFCILICIASDIGGLIFGKIFKGPKLTRISPNKTISGSFGSIIFSILIGLIVNYFTLNIPINKIIFLSFMISLGTQLGDLFFSFLKRKAKIKDTGNILPGHGGILDRIDGILLGLPFGIISIILIFY